jgi:hypothetical protein
MPFDHGGKRRGVAAGLTRRPRRSAEKLRATPTGRDSVRRPLGTARFCRRPRACLRYPGVAPVSGSGSGVLEFTRVVVVLAPAVLSRSFDLDESGQGLDAGRRGRELVARPREDARSTQHSPGTLTRGVEQAKWTREHHDRKLTRMHPAEKPVRRLPCTAIFLKHLSDGLCNDCVPWLRSTAAPRQST